MYSKRFVSLLTRDTLALVLAGGRGTRLGGLTSHRVKPAVPFGGKYRLIDFPLSNCMNSGIRRAGVLTQYKAHSLIGHLGDAWSFLRREFNEFVEVLPAQQRTGPGWYEGTADAVYQNIEVIQAHAPQFVLVLGGDHVYKMDYGVMLGYHVDREADVTVGCIEVPLDEARSFGVMATDESGRVGGFEEKPMHPTPIPGKPGYALSSMGIYVFNTDYLLRMLQEDRTKSGSTHDFGKDLLPTAVADGHRVYAFPFQDLQGNSQGYWRDVGNLDSYWKANLELTDVTPPLDLYDNAWPIWTYQEQAPPAKFVFDEKDRRGTALDSMIAGGCILSGATVRHSLLFPFTRVESNSDLRECVVLPKVHIGPHCRIRRAIVESGCRIQAGEVIGEDPERDHKRFEVSEEGIVLVTPESLGQELPGAR
ncbi:glucose-1-phosphate adenylyltransferase [Nevskia soli]|uniref:glucose-1-phosphate adenylyltransferase n=1 Tax=Nevskia soli TaxID=418856 RepID=UPI0004A6D2C7|nr:glucose-1-phosphate adenylyltransferase [Nevskia soli]